MFWRRKKKTKALIEFQRKWAKDRKMVAPKDASEVVISDIGRNFIETLEKNRTEKIMNGEL
jgi:hypothetical protein